jgi:hypothetical protein
MWKIGFRFERNFARTAFAFRSYGFCFSRRRRAVAEISPGAAGGLARLLPTRDVEALDSDLPRCGG